MNNLILIIFFVLTSSNNIYSQHDASLTAMDSAIVQWFDALKVSDQWSKLSSHLEDSLINRIKKDIPELDTQSLGIVREEWGMLFKDALSPNGDIFKLFSDVHSKYFTAEEIKIVAKAIKSPGEINSSDKVVISKYISLKDSIDNDLNTGLRPLIKNLEYNANKRIEKRFKEEGLINEEDWIWD